MKMETGMMNSIGNASAPGPKKVRKSTRAKPSDCTLVEEDAPVRIYKQSI